MVRVIFRFIDTQPGPSFGRGPAVYDGDEICGKKQADLARGVGVEARGWGERNFDILTNEANK